jgi:hypothetical protein
MQNVLFQTDRPTLTHGRVEFYDLCLIQERSDGQSINLVQETHGWWDNDTNRAILDESVETQCLTYKTFVEALDVYHRQRMLRARSGFKHSFMWHPITGAPAYYSLVEMPGGPRGEWPAQSLEDFAKGA